MKSDLTLTPSPSTAEGEKGDPQGRGEGGRLAAESKAITGYDILEVMERA